jgi:hypothetical protein
MVAAFILIGAASASAIGAASASAQSLADIARQEEARRKAVAGTGKVYTNEALQPEPPPSPGSVPAATPAPAAPATPPAPGADGAKPADPAAPGAAPAGGAKTEAEWKKRMADERDALSRAQIFAEALQSRINVLSADFVNVDDPAQRTVVASERDKALAELNRVKQEIQTHQKMITAIQDEARKAGVPAGWVR